MHETRFGELVTVRVRDADVFDVPGDILLVGRTPALRARIERAAGIRFAKEPRAAPRSLLESAALPWPRVEAVDVPVRGVRVLAHRTAWNHVPHVMRLYGCLSLPQSAGHAVIVPFSWRHPEVFGTALAAWLDLRSRRQRSPLLVDVVALEGSRTLVPWLHAGIEPRDTGWT